MAPERLQAVDALLSEGLSSAEIATTLGIALHTVENYRSIINRSAPQQYRDPFAAQLLANGSRAGVLSAAVHHALGALKLGHVQEAIEVLEAVT